MLDLLSIQNLANIFFSKRFFCCANLSDQYLCMWTISIPIIHSLCLFFSFILYEINWEILYFQCNPKLTILNVSIVICGCDFTDCYINKALRFQALVQDWRSLNKDIEKHYLQKQTTLLACKGLTTFSISGFGSVWKLFNLLDIPEPLVS